MFSQPLSLSVSPPTNSGNTCGLRVETGDQERERVHTSPSSRSHDKCHFFYLGRQSLRMPIVGWTQYPRLGKKKRAPFERTPGENGKRGMIVNRIHDKSRIHGSQIRMVSNVTGSPGVVVSCVSLAVLPTDHDPVRVIHNTGTT